MPNRWQQVVRGSELRGALDVSGLAVRKDDRINAYQGRTIDVEIRMGHTTRDEQTLGTDFAANFDAGASVVVLPRGQRRLTDFDFSPPATFDEFAHAFAFPAPFAFRAQGTRNLLIEVAVFGNDGNNQPILWPMDSGTGTTSTMLYANGATATTGVLSPGHGLALRLLTPRNRLAAFAHCLNPSGAVGRRSNTLTGGNPPLLGSTTTLDLFAPTYDFGALAVSASARTLELPMAGYSLVVHADLATLVTLPVTLDAQGYVFLPLPLPNDPGLAGLDLAFQGVVSSRAQPFQLGATNLVLANLGNSLLGSAVFAMTFGPFGIPPLSYMLNPDGSQKVVHQAGEGGDKIVIQGTKQANVGPLEIRVTNPPRTIVIPAGADTFSQSIDVGPGGQVFFYNASATQSMSGVTWEVTVVR